MGFQNFIDQHIFPASSDPDYGDNPPSYGQQTSEFSLPIQPVDSALMPYSNSQGSKVKPPKGAVQHPDEAALLEGIKPLKGNDFDNVVQVIAKYGVHPQDPKFLQYLGATAEQNGMLPSSRLGPLAAIRDRLFPDAQKLQARQEALEQMGGLVFGEMAKAKLEAMHGPQTRADAERILGPGAAGVLPPVQEQGRTGMMADPTQHGPMPPTATTETPLTTEQQMQIQPFMKSYAGGHLTKDAEGNLVPTSYAAMQGKMVGSDIADWATKYIDTPIGQQPPLPPHPVAPTVLTALSNQRSDRWKQIEKPIDYNNKLESLTTAETARLYGRPMRFDELSRVNQPLAAQLRQRAEIQEPKDMYEYQQGEQYKRQVSAAEPVKAGQIQADLKAPVGGDIAHYSRLTPDGRIDKPSNPKLSQHDLNAQGYVNTKQFKPEIDSYNHLDVVDNDLVKLRSYADELFKAGPGAFALTKQGLGLKLARVTEGGAPTSIRGANGERLTRGQVANLYAKEVNSMLEYYGRNLRGLRGAATEGDVQRMASSFATDFTTAGGKDKLFADQRNFINDVRQAGIKTVFGNGPQAAEVRYHQLKKQGLGDDAIYQKLGSEGYTQ